MTDNLLLDSVAFDAPVVTPNGQGGQISGWQEKFCARARFRFLRGGETVLQARLSGQQTIVVTVRDCVDARMITPEWRMRDLRTGTEYNIRSIMPSDDRLYRELTCQSGVAV